MDYVGMDHMIGLSCGSCNRTMTILYSRLLNSVLDGKAIVCDGCGRITKHGWDSIEHARLLVSRRMREARSCRSLRREPLA
jgi:hypothetical protein